MTSMASSKTHFYIRNIYKSNSKSSVTPQINLSVVSQQKHQEESPKQTTHQKGLSGKKPDYLGVQKNPPGLALCPATKNCVSTSENISDLTHYAPPWNYNPEQGRGSKNPVSKEQAMEELLEVVETTKPDDFRPKVAEQRDDYVRVEYESPFLGFVDDVEFWFPPGEKSIVQYRSASRLGHFDFDMNRKRIKALRVALEKKGWASEKSL
ncbi:hypothetical protein CDL12_02603 [Handroanthus impetiginosus]|uniref:DUF1499 domain-containing protein n=1 Tax=Handroanthus impetiginosus TaxID=429701 RepID=A0A2G9I4I1_9LAMI|nr:hypothetical protein CDL12_02603 [Handroanthus impetiginosus]